MTAAIKVEKWACSSCHKEYYVEGLAENCCTDFVGRCPECGELVRVIKSDKYTDYLCKCGWSGRSS